MSGSLRSRACRSRRGAARARRHAVSARAVDVLAAHLDAMLALTPEPITRAVDLRDLAASPTTHPVSSTPRSRRSSLTWTGAMRGWRS